MRTYFYLCAKCLFTAIGLLLLIMLIGKPHGGTPALAQGPQTTAFVNVNVIPMDTERVLENQTVIVEGDRITTIGPADEVAVPEGAEIVEGNGAYLMPGLADMHMHNESPDPNPFGGSGQLRIYLAEGVTTIRNLSAWPEDLVWRDEIARGELIGPTFYNGRQIVGLPSFLQSMRYTFRAIVVLAPVVIGLMIWLVLGVVLKLTGKQAQFGQIRRYILPSLAVLLLVGGLAAWLKIIPLNAYTSLSIPSVTITETETEARRYVREIKEAGYDFVKPYDWLSAEAYLATLDEARQQNMYAVGHLLDELSLEAVFSGGLQEVAHMDEFMTFHMIGEAFPNTGFNEVEFDYETIPQSASLAKAYEVMVVSNMVTDETVYLLLEDPQGVLARTEYGVVQPEVLHTWKTEGRAVNWQGQQAWRRHTLQPFLMTMTKALHDAGVPLLIGTDTSVEGMLPSHIHRELELLVEAGLTPFEALEAGTKNAGISVARMGRDGSFGTVEVGQIADLILLEENPLENVGHTRNRLGVMVRGDWFTQVELDRLVDEFVATYRADGSLTSK